MVEKEGPPIVRLRNENPIFSRTQTQKVVNDFGPGDAAIILNNLNSFEQAWKKSITDDDLPSRYKFKQYKGIKRPYKLYQIYVGPNRKNLSYRAVIMFYCEFTRACWIYVFKKERMSERQEVELAETRAESYWNIVQEK
ncbi:MAG TPA: hypothetical protein VKY19_06975 [Ktedonosporobacter sp.]|jgi:hypothetical protein|nr:hypothetical protein [Ktedonosporobacter sp.]